MTIYDGYKPCADLKAGEFCLVVEQYSEGVVRRCEHLHLPRHRISKPSRVELLKALVCRFNGFSGLGFDLIVASYLNDRKGGTARQDPFRIEVSYPEPGVLRTYCGTNTRVWLDEVISVRHFRKT